MYRCVWKEKCSFVLAQMSMNICGISLWSWCVKIWNALKVYTFLNIKKTLSFSAEWKYFFHLTIMIELTFFSKRNIFFSFSTYGIVLVWLRLQRYVQVPPNIRKRNLGQKQDTWLGWMTRMYRRCLVLACVMNQFVLYLITVIAREIWINFCKSMSLKRDPLAFRANHWGKF